ncbi:MAG: magnesium chelatase subunit D [Paracoccaceae bacterium]
MTTDWDRVYAGLAALLTRPTGLGGMVLRMRASPDRDLVMAYIKHLFPDMVRISPSIDDLHLFGGIDVSATLSTGHLHEHSGLLTTPRILCLTMAERCSGALAARLAQYLDMHPTAILITLDEGAEPEEGLPATLRERLAFFVEPAGHCPGNSMPISQHIEQRAFAPDTEALEALTLTAAQFGIPSLRAPSMAMNTAFALAQCANRNKVEHTDLSQAAEMVFAHRATQVPSDDTQDEPGQTPPPPDETPEDNAAGSDQMTDLSRDMIVEAVTAMLPPEMLAGMGRMNALGGVKGTGAGQKKQSNRRGRPMPSRAGRLDGRRRLDILSTLRAAAPWQPMRRKQTPDRKGLLLRPSDFRLKRYENKSDRVVIFAVDASGSAAISRLNEAKGAIELLLGQAYAARDYVSLVSFRGETAETLLPPTRSLVQTKRKLTAMPGGGGTPLAAGLLEASKIAIQARGRGMTPVIVLVTDGKTNIALDGTPDRTKAREDSSKLATQVRTLGLDVLVVDISTRPHTQLRDLSQHLDAHYLPLPRADAHKLSGAINAAFETA